MDKAKTGTRDETYNLLSVVYHALQGAETIEQYIQDAEEAGDQELARFFRDILEEDRDRADRAKVLLRDRLGKSGLRREQEEDLVDKASKDSFPASDAPASY
jgi:hypothetical protein